MFMKNWIIVFLIFVIPLGIYGYLDCVAKEDTKVIAENISALEVNDIKQTPIGTMPTVYKFSSPMCGDCKKLAKEIAPVITKWKNKVVFKDINVSGTEGEQKAVKDMIAKYKITTVPTLIYMDKNGKFVKKTEGYVSSDDIETTLRALSGEK